MSLSESLTRKLTALKKLAESSKNEEEGTAALLAMQRLMKSNDLTESDLDFEDEVETVDTVDTNLVTKMPFLWQRDLHTVIATNFRCIPVTETHSSHRSHGKSTIRFKFVGKGKDAELAKEAFHLALQVIDSLWETKKESLRIYNIIFTPEDKKNYGLGFVHGLRRAYAEQRANSELGIIIVRAPEVDKAVEGFGKVSFNVDREEGLIGHLGFRDGDNYAKGNVLSNVGGL